MIGNHANDSSYQIHNLERRTCGRDDVEVVDEGDEIGFVDVFGLNIGCPGSEEGFACSRLGLGDDDGSRERGWEGWETTGVSGEGEGLGEDGVVGRWL